jgi:hypothetical protein
LVFYLLYFPNFWVVTWRDHPCHKEAEENQRVPCPVADVLTSVGHDGAAMLVRLVRGVSGELLEASPQARVSERMKGLQGAGVSHRSLLKPGFPGSHGAAGKRRWRGATEKKVRGVMREWRKDSGCNPTSFIGNGCGPTVPCTPALTTLRAPRTQRVATSSTPSSSFHFSRESRRRG